MELLTKEHRERLIKNHELHKEAYNQEHPEDKSSKVVVKLFNPTGVGTWYLSEMNPYSEIMYGLCCIGEEPEIGSVSLKELKELKTPPLGLGVERDKVFPMNKYTHDECRKL